ncbi:MAG: hypothetical protein K9L17_05965 [Clostridiales bacterium]|nr:hypothetical protein [Clostridiales bacterium]MCF8022218.1 hypothetical protein [Clostridiales bacterium]
MTLIDYNIYKSILWFIVDNDRLPYLEDIAYNLAMPTGMARKRIETLQHKGILDLKPEGIKILKEVFWCKRKNKPCY